MLSSMKSNSKYSPKHKWKKGKVQMRYLFSQLYLSVFDLNDTYISLTTHMKSPVLTSGWAAKQSFVAASIFKWFR